MRERIGWMTLGLALLGSWIPDAAADITFPFTFSAGTPAVADQVNQNFQAVNARQSATAASLAGTWTFQYTGVVSLDRTIGVPYHYMAPDPASSSGAFILVNDVANAPNVPFTCVSVVAGTVTFAANGTGTLAGTVAAVGSNCDPGVRTASVPFSFTVAADGSGSTGPIQDGGGLSFRVSKDLNSMVLWKTGATEVGSGHAVRN